MWSGPGGGLFAGFSRLPSPLCWQHLFLITRSLGIRSDTSIRFSLLVPVVVSVRCSGGGPGLGLVSCRMRLLDCGHERVHASRYFWAHFFESNISDSLFMF